MKMKELEYGGQLASSKKTTIYFWMTLKHYKINKKLTNSVGIYGSKEICTLAMALLQLQDKKLGSLFKNRTILSKYSINSYSGSTI